MHGLLVKHPFGHTKQRTESAGVFILENLKWTLIGIVRLSASLVGNDAPCPKILVCDVGLTPSVEMCKGVQSLK